KAAARDALERYGTALTGSRFLNGTIPLHVELEREIAEWMGTEDALVFTTGYQANLGAIGTILEPGDTVICDSGDHASILHGRRRSRSVGRGAGGRPDLPDRGRPAVREAARQRRLPAPGLRRARP